RAGRHLAARTTPAAGRRRGRQRAAAPNAVRLGRQARAAARDRAGRSRAADARASRRGGGLSMPTPRRVFFLPGASGVGDFWRPVGARLPDTWDKVFFDWPGLGDVPADPRIQSFDDLASLVIASLDDSPADLVAQSMGGLVALKVALAQPAAVRRL